MAQNLCYFSKKCRFCQGFLEELAKSPFFKEIRFVCVDPSPNRGPLPAWLKVVPTMILANGEETLVGPQAVNNWLFSRRLLQSGSAESKSGGSKETSEPLRVPEYSPNVTTRPTPAPKHDTGSHPSSAPSDGTEPLPWHDAEMAGGNWSDSYSFVDDPFTAEKGLNRIIRNFESLGGPVGTPGSSTGGSSGGGSSAGKPQQRSAKEDKLLKDFESFSKMRDLEFSAPKRMG